MAQQLITNNELSLLSGIVTGASLKLSSLTSGRVTYATTAGLLTDSSALTFDGTTLTTTKFAGALNGTVGATTPSTVVATSVTNSGLTSGRVTFAGASGILSDSTNLTFDGTRLRTAGLDIATASGTVNSIQMTGSATAAVYTLYQNTGGNFYVGRDNSAGNFFGTAYASYLYSTGAYPMLFLTNDVVRLTITSAGIVTTALDASINGLTLGKGTGALASNTAFGLEPLFSNTSGGFNTAVGRYALTSNTTGANNAAFGRSLISNTTGSQNTVVWRHPMLDDSKTWKKKTPDSNACLQNSAWITPS